jgi:hypothetical protein
MDGGSDLRKLRLRPAFAGLHSSPDGVSADRRDTISRRALVHRVQAEFLEMPGLILSIDQATRLFGLQSSVCARVLGEMLHEHRLRLTTDGRYALLRKAV